MRCCLETSHATQGKRRSGCEEHWYSEAMPCAKTDPPASSPVKVPWKEPIGTPFGNCFPSTRASLFRRSEMGLLLTSGTTVGFQEDHCSTSLLLSTATPVSKLCLFGLISTMVPRPSRLATAQLSTVMDLLSAAEPDRHRSPLFSAEQPFLTLHDHSVTALWDLPRCTTTRSSTSAAGTSGSIGTKWSSPRCHPPSNA